MIVIPMAGLSSRFKKAGYKLPKYMLEAHGKTLFTHSVESFKAYFSSEKFLFIALDVLDTKRFIEQECQKMGIADFETVILPEPTRGQAETVFLGLQQLGLIQDEHILIFNIDTFRPGFTWPKEFDIKSIDGYLETFIGSGKNWSNIEPKNNDDYTVKRTAEKQEISEYCCTGLYYFNSFKEYSKLYSTYSKQNLDEIDAGEYYIAPMYNLMINEGADIRYSVVDKDDVIFCGVPDEYRRFLNANPAD
jgi:bifunctional N-acetylglucosamine-1-phosphate-uridyltransferase/glucosamine-1-phosphate-acetyltransferase GlmU-like protein